MGFAYLRTVTVDHTQVGAGGVTNFAVPLIFSDASMKTVAHGGHVQNASGYDLVLFTDSTLVTKVNYSLIFYDGVNGVIGLYVEAAALSSAGYSTPFVLAYGNPAISTPQSPGNPFQASCVLAAPLAIRYLK